jgi:hypothetical protein
MIGFCLSRRGKIATADVMECYACDWSDAPDWMGGCYVPVTFEAREWADLVAATVPTCCASG